jgi:hypothetical protein
MDGLPIRADDGGCLAETNDARLLKQRILAEVSLAFGLSVTTVMDFELGTTGGTAVAALRLDGGPPHAVGFDDGDLGRSELEPPDEQ